MLPPAASAASSNDGAYGHAVPSAQAAAGGAGPPPANLREELDSLRKQIADMAMERDVLMRSAAMWAQQAMDRPDG
ncbi:hypothetical protein A5677_21720 [Mycobacterium malmoense]|uniref:Uncharacterized protein n=1 Tax=Mycobacterium malmoense TaxID=1780 RepID=A0A1B9D7G9_MYCMA|nr:hypothetical protein A5677_21720 [Mycobacterium malmoense]